jgi:hypothetical protein
MAPGIIQPVKMGWRQRNGVLGSVHSYDSTDTPMLVIEGSRNGLKAASVTLLQYSTEAQTWPSPDLYITVCIVEMFLSDQVMGSVIGLSRDSTKLTVASTKVNY